eukprot:scaffold86628_cov81-Phaeocystis_antarctica.AAC.2
MGSVRAPLACCAAVRLLAHAHLLLHELERPAQVMPPHVHRSPRVKKLHEDGLSGEGGRVRIDGVHERGPSLRVFAVNVGARIEERLARLRAAAAHGEGERAVVKEAHRREQRRVRATGLADRLHHVKVRLVGGKRRHAPVRGQAQATAAAATLSNLVSEQLPPGIALDLHGIGHLRRPWHLVHSLHQCGWELDHNI